MTRDEAAGYLAGMIDGEGSVAHVGRQQRSVTISNTDPELLDACEEACISLGITCKQKWTQPSRNGRKPLGILYIFSKENFVTLLADVPIQSIRKRATLEGAVASYVRK